MRIDVLTLFPKMLSGFISESVIGRALREQLFSLQIHNLRDWAKDARRTVDDRPFGGGAGMVLRPEPLFDAVNALKSGGVHVVYLCPDGFSLTTSKARELSQREHLLLVSGHYEGVDERFREQCVDEEISIGDYVLTGGELPAMVLTDCVSRYVDGVISISSLVDESFSDNLLEYPQYTRPQEYKGLCVPEVLRSGDHAKVDQWRKEQSIAITKKLRPDLLKK
jgi:tRNA (guanine37-N1)-methyltransferase